MLIYFSAENYRSIKDRIELNMQPAPRMRKHKNHVVDLKHKNKLKALRTAVIFGANASGKSNIVKAMKYAHDLIVDGPKHKSGIPQEPFKFSVEKNEVSSFCFEFVVSNQYYIYSFDVSSKYVEKESLHHINGNDEVCVYERIIKDSSVIIRSDYKKSNTEESEQLISLINFTNKNQLVLNEICEKNAYEKFDSHIGRDLFFSSFFFEQKLVIIFPETTYSGIISDFHKNHHSAYETALSAFDTGIKSLSTKEEPISKFDPDLIDEIRQDLMERPDSHFKDANFNFNNKQYTASLNEDNELVVYSAIAEHEVIGGGNETLDINDESDGTRRLLDLLPAICSVNEETEGAELFASRTYVIDEFDRSLHPNLSKAFLGKFLSCEVSLGMDQLIVTTHEDALLDNSLLRRDEIWFVQKERDSSSQLYSLNDYNPRFDKDIQKDYLSGKFGAVPYIMEGYVEGSRNDC